MASGWFVKRGEKERGPFSTQELKSLAASGKLKKTDFIRKDGTQKAVPITKVKGLFSTAPQQTKKPQPAQKGSPDDFDGAGYAEDPEAEIFDAIDEYADDYGEEVEEYEAEPPRKRGSRSRGGTPPARRRNSNGRKAAAAGKPSKKRKPAKKSGDTDEEENSLWANFFYGLACLIGGILFFIALGEEEPTDWGNRGGLIKLAVQLVYNIGGRWAVLIFMGLCSALFFWPAFKQLRER